MPMIESALQTGYENEHTTNYFVEVRPIQKSRPLTFLERVAIRWNSPNATRHRFDTDRASQSA